MRNGDTALLRMTQDSSAVFMSAIVIGELLYGFQHGSRYEQNLHKLREFLDRPTVHFLPVTQSSAEHFGLIAAALRKKGRPIPQNDIWIAAHAIEFGAQLISADRHFHHVDGLDWQALGGKP